LLVSLDRGLNTLQVIKKNLNFRQLGKKVKVDKDVKMSLFEIFSF